MKSIWTLKETHKRQIIGMLLLSLIIAGGVIVFSKMNISSADSKLKTITSSTNNLTGFNGISATVNVLVVDVIAAKFVIKVTLQPIGSLALHPNDPINRLNTNMTILAGTKLLNCTANYPLTVQELLVYFSDINTNNYPFDVYTSSLQFAAFTSPTDVSTRVSVVMLGAIQGWDFTFQPIEYTNENGSYVQASIQAKRSVTTIFFSMFIGIAMWVLAISTFVLTATLGFRQRKVEPGTLGFVGSMLFALPAIRNTQPGIPDIGCTADLAGFMWVMFLVMISTVMMMWNYIFKYGKDKVPETLSKTVFPDSSAQSFDSDKTFVDYRETKFPQGDKSFVDYRDKKLPSKIEFKDYSRNPYASPTSPKSRNQPPSPLRETYADQHSAQDQDTNYVIHDEIQYQTQPHHQQQYENPISPKSPFPNSPMISPRRYSPAERTESGVEVASFDNYDMESGPIVPSRVQRKLFSGRSSPMPGRPPISPRSRSRVPTDHY